MKLKKISIASLAIGAMLSVTACSTSTEKEQANQSKKEQTNAQEEVKTTSAEQNTSKNEDKDSKATNAEQSTNGKNETKSTSTEQTKNEKNGTKETKSTSTSVKSGVKEVVQLIEEVDKQLKATPKQEAVNKLGKQLTDKWDVVEEAVEAQHASDYKTIEQNLYPLIVEMGKQKQDVKKLKTLTTKTKQNLNQLLNKL